MTVETIIWENLLLTRLSLNGVVRTMVMVVVSVNIQIGKGTK